MASNNHGLGKILQLREFKWVLRSSIWIVFDYFLLIKINIEVKLVAINIEFNSRSAKTIFHF